MRKIALLLCAALVGVAMSGADTMSLKLKWPVGKKLTMRADLETQNHMDMGAAGKIDQNITQRMDYAVSFLKRLPEGGVEMETEFLAFNMDMSGGPVKMSYDSAKDKPDALANPFSCLGALVGKKLKAVLDADGKVVKLEGLEQLLAGLPANPMFKAMLSEEKLKAMSGCDIFSKGLGKRRVKVGESWSDEMSTDLGQQGGLLRVKLDCTYVGMEKRLGRDCARVDFTENTSVSPAVAKGMEIGELKGSSWYAPSLGVVIDTTMEVSMRMKVTTLAPPANGGKPAYTEMACDLKSKVSNSLVSVEAIK